MRRPAIIWMLASFVLGLGLDATAQGRGFRRGCKPCPPACNMVWSLYVCENGCWVWRWSSKDYCTTRSYADFINCNGANPNQPVPCCRIVYERQQMRICDATTKEYCVYICKENPPLWVLVGTGSDHEEMKNYVSSELNCPTECPECIDPVVRPKREICCHKIVERGSEGEPVAGTPCCLPPSPPNGK